jgi:hypothetical protein
VSMRLIELGFNSTCKNSMAFQDSRVLREVARTIL